MAKPKSVIGNYLKELSKPERNYEIKQNFRNTVGNKLGDRLFLKIEEEHTEFKGIKTAMAYNEQGDSFLMKKGLLVTTGKLTFYKCKLKQTLFGKQPYDYTLEEHDIGEIEIKVKDQTDRYGRDTYYVVNIIKTGENIAFFYCSRKIFDGFIEVFEQEKVAFA